MTPLIGYRSATSITSKCRRRTGSRPRTWTARGSGSRRVPVAGSGRTRGSARPIAKASAGSALVRATTRRPIRSFLWPSPGRSLEPAKRKPAARASAQRARWAHVCRGSPSEEDVPDEQRDDDDCRHAQRALAHDLRTDPQCRQGCTCPEVRRDEGGQASRGRPLQRHDARRAGCEPSASWAGKLTLERCVCGVPAMVMATALDRQALAHSWPLCARASRARAGRGRPLRRVPSALAHA